MELTAVNVSAAVHKSGTDTINVLAGQCLRIETTPAGEELLDTECPAGKVWAARIIVEIIETDA